MGFRGQTTSPTYAGRDRLVATAGNNTLTLGADPINGSLILWKQTAGAGAYTLLWPAVDYTISGNVATLSSPLGPDDVLATYYLATVQPGPSGLSGDAPTPPGLNQQKLCGPFNTTTTFTLDAPVSATDLIVIFATTEGYLNQGMTVSGLGAAQWTTRQQLYDAPNGGTIPMFYAITGANPTAGQQTITFTPPSSITSVAWVGVFNKATYKMSQGAIGLGTAASSGAALNLAAGDTAIVGLGVINNPAATPTDTPTPWTSITASGVFGTDSLVQYGGYLAAQAAETANRTYTLGSSQRWRSAAVIISAA